MFAMVARPIILFIVSLATLMVLAGAAAGQQPITWERYENQRFGYSVELPLGLFEPDLEADDTNGLTLFEVRGQGQVVIYGALNEGGHTPAQFAALLEQEGRIGDITYRAGGDNWFVLSGHYQSEDRATAGGLIFYTKFLFNEDRSAVSAFEVSYPATDKERYDPIVTHLEKSLRSPRL